MSANHAVHMYETDAHLAAIVGAFVQAGLARGDTAIVVATAARRPRILGTLASHGVDVSAAIEGGRLLLVDADELAALARGPDGVSAVWSRFLGNIAIARRSSGRAGLTIWGETTDLLMQAGAHAEFHDLERRWSEVTASDPTITLLCAYRADLLDHAIYRGELQNACAHHTHVHDVEAVAIGDRSLEHGLGAVLGPRMAAMATSVSDADPEPIRGLPVFVARIVWLEANMPLTCARVTAAAQAQRQEGEESPQARRVR